MFDKPYFHKCSYFGDSDSIFTSSCDGAHCSVHTTLASNHLVTIDGSTKTTFWDSVEVFVVTYCHYIEGINIKHTFRIGKDIMKLIVVCFYIWLVVDKRFVAQFEAKQLFDCLIKCSFCVHIYKCTRIALPQKELNFTIWVCHIFSIQRNITTQAKI